MFGVQSFGDVSPYVCSYNFCSVSVAEWPPFGKYIAAHSVGHMFSLYYWLFSVLILRAGFGF